MNKIQNGTDRADTGKLAEFSSRGETNNCVEYFNSYQWTVFAVTVIVGLLYRWILLDERPLHHDESLHVMYSKYIYDNPQWGHYKYDPMLHGPLLYNIGFLSFLTFGVTEWAGRAPVAIMGSIYILIPFLFRKYFTPATTLLTTAFIAFSPTLIYWSKFLREDFYVITPILIMMYGLFLSKGALKVFWVFFGFTLHLCSKENIYVHVALVLGYIIYSRFIGQIREHYIKLKSNEESDLFSTLINICFKSYIPLAILLSVALVVNAYFFNFVVEVFQGKISPANMQNSWQKIALDLLHYLDAILIFVICGISITLYSRLNSKLDNNDKMPTKIKDFFDDWRLPLGQVVLISIVCSLVFTFFFGGAFQYSKGIRDMLIGTPISYWLNQHGIERIQGPFLFHFYVLSWYESIFVLLIFLHGFLFYKRADFIIKLIATVAFVLSIFFYIKTYNKTVEEIQLNPFFKFFKPKNALDVFSILIILLHPVLITTDHLLKGENKLAAAGYTFGALFFTYSYLGEKVPWLSMYPFVGGIIYFAMYFQDYYTRFPIRDWKEYRLNTLFCCLSGILIFVGVVFLFQDGTNWTTNKGTFTVLALGIIIFIISLADYITDFMGRVNLVNFFSIVAVIFMLRSAYLTNFVYSGEASEFISQVHTTREIVNMAKDVVEDIKNEKKGFKPDVYVDGDPVWPLTWYFRNIPENYKFQGNATTQQKDSAYWKFVSWKENETTPPSGYRYQRVNLRGWWVPDYTKMTFKNFLLYALNHQPWSGTGYSYSSVFVKE